MITTSILFNLKPKLYVNKLICVVRNRVHIVHYLLIDFTCFHCILLLSVHDNTSMIDNKISVSYVSIRFELAMVFVTSERDFER